MYRKDDEILIGNPASNHRRKVVAVHDGQVWVRQDEPVYGPKDELLDLTNTYPLPPEGREVEAEWRVPVKGDTVYDKLLGWISAEDWGCDVPSSLTDPLNLGWRRPVLVPLPAPKPNRIEELKVDGVGKAVVQCAEGWDYLDYLQKMSDVSLLSFGYTDADIKVIRAGLPADVRRYLASKPEDAEAELRVPKLEEWYWTRGSITNDCYWCADIGRLNVFDWPYLGRRRWILKAATPATVTTMNIPATDYGTLRQENAKLRAEVERLAATLANIARKAERAAGGVA